MCPHFITAPPAIKTRQNSKSSTNKCPSGAKRNLNHHLSNVQGSGTLNIQWHIANTNIESRICIGSYHYQDAWGREHHKRTVHGDSHTNRRSILYHSMLFALGETVRDSRLHDTTCKDVAQECVQKKSAFSWRKPHTWGKVEIDNSPFGIHRRKLYSARVSMERIKVGAHP